MYVRNHLFTGISLSGVKLSFVSEGLLALLAISSAAGAIGWWWIQRWRETTNKSHDFPHISFVFIPCCFFGQVIFGSSCSWRWREARHRSKKKKNKFERLFCIVRETEFSHQTPWQGVLPPPPLPPPPLVMVTAVSQYPPDIVLLVLLVVFQVRLRNYHTLSTWFYFASSCLRCGKIWIFANEGLRRQDQFWP